MRDDAWSWKPRRNQQQNNLNQPGFVTYADHMYSATVTPTDIAKQPAIIWVGCSFSIRWGFALEERIYAIYIYIYVCVYIHISFSLSLSNSLSLSLSPSPSGPQCMSIGSIDSSELLGTSAWHGNINDSASGQQPHFNIFFMGVRHVGKTKYIFSNTYGGVVHFIYLLAFKYGVLGWTPLNSSPSVQLNKNNSTNLLIWICLQT